MKKYIDKRLFAILLCYMVTYNIVYLGRRTILKGLGQPEYFELSWWSTSFEPLLSSFLIVPPLILLIVISTKIMIDENMKWSFVFIIHFVLSLVYSLVLTAFGYVYESIFYNTNLWAITLEDFFVRTIYGSNLNYLGYIGFVTITYAYYYVQKISNTEIQKAQLAKQLQDVRLQVLKSQLNPHFLFNTLNTISSLIQEDPLKAQHTVGNLGDLLRDVLLIKDKPMITVSKEFVILKRYIHIMQIRFSDHLTFESCVQEEVQKVLIPSMLLQPIIENSFKHGYSYEFTSLKVILSIYQKEEWLVIEIENNGAPITADQNDGLGIKNVKERLWTLYGSKHQYLFKNLENQLGVLTRIKIPLNT